MDGDPKREDGKMAKKMLRKQRIAIQKLEDRVLFDAAGAAEVVEAAAAADAASQAADAQDAQEGDGSADEQNGAVTAPPEDASQSQESAEAEVQTASGAEAAGSAADAADDDASFDPAASLADNTELADSLTGAADADDAVAAELDDITPQEADSDDGDDADASLPEPDDADVSGADTDADDGDDAVVFADAFASQADDAVESGPRELVILSDYVKDQDEIIAQLSENTDVLVLKRGEDPLDQINEYLDSREGVQYSAVHVVSHGNAGYFLLNDTIIDARAVADDPAGWRAIGEHLTSDGDIMIYGCNVAGSEDGRAMIAGIADLTGADVAASAEKVGSANGWSLEYAYGIVDTQNIVIDNVSWSLGSYTLVEYGSSNYNWDGPTDAHTTYYSFDGDTGHLRVNTWVTDHWVSSLVEGDYGNASYCLTRAAAAAGEDIIVISSGNVVSGALGDVTAAVNAGGLRITADASGSASVGTITRGLTVDGSGAFTFTGDVAINSGSADLDLRATGGFSFNGAVTVTAGSLYLGNNTSANFASGATINAAWGLGIGGNVSVGGTVININSDFAIDSGRTLNIDGGTVVNVNNSSNFTLNGSITGEGTVNFGGMERLAGSGRINMTGRANYAQVTTDGLTSVYEGSYGTLGLALSDNIILSDTFFVHRTVGTLNVSEAHTVTMSGVFQDVATRVSTTSATFLYTDSGTQYILGGGYQDLTVGGTSARSLLGSIEVAGTMQLGTTLDTAGYNVHFGNDLGNGETSNYGADPGRISATGGNVVYHKVGLAGSHVFYSGTYYNLTIDGAGTTFAMDKDASIANLFTVRGSAESDFSVTASARIERVGRIQVQDASLNVTGTIDGNIESISATITEGAPARTLQLNALGDVGSIAINGVTTTFRESVGNVGTVTIGAPDTMGILGTTVNFDGAVADITNLVLSNESIVNFARSVNISHSIRDGSLTPRDNTFNFNGETTGGATVDMLRGTVNYNYDGDQTIFRGTYNDFNIRGSGVKTAIGDTTIAGVFNGSAANITVNTNSTFAFSTFREDTADIPHRPVFTVNEGAVLQFNNTNTSGVDFYGTITASGEIRVMGQGHYHGAITLEGTGTMTVDSAAVGSVFDGIVNRGAGFVISTAVTVSSLHNYGTVTVENNDVRLDVYNHSGATLVFNLNSGTKAAGVYEFVFDRGEGTAQWDPQTPYSAGAEVTDGSMYVAAYGAVPPGIEPGVEYWRAVDAYSQNQTYNAGDLVYDGTTVYRAVRNTAVSQALGGPGLSNLDYWDVVEAGVAAYAAGNEYDTGDYVRHTGTIYFAVTDVAANTAAPGRVYWTPVAAETANRLINGGTVSVTAGQLTLNAFTQGDKDAQYGSWTYGGEAYGVGADATLVLNAGAAVFNSGNVNPPGEGALLGNITNAGTFDLGVGLSLKGDVVNAENSRFIVAAPVAFRGSVTHDGAFVTGNAAAALTFANAVSGNGTVGEAETGYAGEVRYTAASSEQISQRILDGIYNNTVAIGGNTAKTIDGDVVFNGRVENSMTIGGSGSVTFNGVTAAYEGVLGSFTGSVDATYSAASPVIYAGTYGDLEIRSGTGAGARSVAVELAAANLVVSGDNTFEAQNAAGNDISLTVNGTVTLAENSNTTFRVLRGAAVISGAPGGTVEFASADTPDAVVDRIQGTATYSAAEDQTVLSGTYGNLTLSNGHKTVSSAVTVSTGGVLTATASTTVADGAELAVNGTADMGVVTVTDGSTLSITGQVAINEITVEEGSTLALSLGDGTTHRLGTAGDPATGGVVLGGQLTVTNQYGATGRLTIYKWEDLPDADSATGLITINGADTTVVFADGFDNYGAVMATIECISGTIEDDTSRLQNRWIIIDGSQGLNQNTWYLSQLYSAASKFKLINGVTLTVNGFREGGGTPIDGIAAILLQDNSVLRISEMAEDPSVAVNAFVGDLTVESGTVIFDDSAAIESLTVTNSAVLHGTAFSGPGNVIFNGETFHAELSGDGTFNMTGGSVTYAGDQPIYGGTYFDIGINGNTVDNAITVGGTAAVTADAVFNGALTVNGTIEDTDNVGVTLNGAVSGTGSFNFDGDGVVTYGANAGSVLGGSYSHISLADNASFALLGDMTIADARGRGTVNDASAAYTVTYTGGSKVYGGTYGDLALTGGTDAQNVLTYTVISDAAVNGEAAVGEFAKIGAGDGITVRFNGSTSGDGSADFSTGGRAVYGDSVTVLRGLYNDLELNSGAVAAGQLDGADDGIVVNGTFSLTTPGVLAGDFSFTLNGDTANVTAVDQTDGVMTYGNGSSVMNGVYNDLTLKSGADAGSVLTYTAQGDVTVAGHSSIGQYAVLAAEGSPTISVAGEDFTLVSGRGYSRVWQNAAGSRTVLYQNGRWELLESGTAADWTVGSSIDPFDTVWQTGGADFVTGNMVTVSFTGSTNAADPAAGRVSMGDYTAVVYSAGVDMYAGDYFRFKIDGGAADVLFGTIPGEINITGDLIVNVSDNHYFVFDQPVGDVHFSITINGDIWYTNDFLAASVPFAGSFAGSIRLGGVYNPDHESPTARTPYDGDVRLEGITITGDDRYIDATVVTGTLSIKDTTFTGHNFQLRVAQDPDLRAGIEYRGDSTIMALYAWNGSAYASVAYKTLILDGNLSVASGDTVEVTDQLTFRENATLTVYGDFRLGAAASAAALSAVMPHTNLIVAAGASVSKIDLYVGDRTVIPVLANFGSGELNITAGNYVAVAAWGNVSNGGSVELFGGTVTITAGDGFSVNGRILVPGGTLNVFAGDNAALKGASLEVVANAAFDLGEGAVINGAIAVSSGGNLTIAADDVKLKGTAVGIGGTAVFDFGDSADAATSTIANSLVVSGSGASLEIAGNNVSLQGFVTVYDGGTLTVTGSNVGFTNDVLNYYVGTIGEGTYRGTGYKWTHDYLFSDAEYYHYYMNGHTYAAAPDSPGTITIASSGKVTFSELVVSGGEFNISSGSVHFNAEFAVSGGEFNITGGEVTFAHDVYVSVVYGTGEEETPHTTYFNVTGGSVTVSGSLYNWVRIPVGYVQKPTATWTFTGAFWQDKNNKIHMRESLNSSHVIIGGNAQVTVTGNVSDVGVWGRTEFLLKDSAQMTVRGNLAVYSEKSSSFWNSSSDETARVKYDYLVNLMGFDKSGSFNPGESESDPRTMSEGNATYPRLPDIFDSSSAPVQSTFTIDNSARLQVEGETWSGATYSTRGGAWGTTTGGRGWTLFTVNSSNNQFTGLFTNSSHFFVNGSGNSFGDVQSRYFMYVNDTNSFGTITNYQDLKITNPGAVVLSLVNEGGKVWITGDADGFVFANELTVRGGSVSIESEFGVDISSPVSVSNNGELVFSARNTLADTVGVTSGKLTFAGEAGGSRLRSTVTVGQNGTLNVSTGDNQVIFDGTVFNSGNFVVDGSIAVGSVVTNSGKLTISKVSVFSGELRNSAGGTVLVAAPAAGTSFAAINNEGSFTNAADNVTYDGAFTNSGTFVNNNGVDASFSGSFTNSGTMKIDGTIAVYGLFTNTSDDVYIYGLADFDGSVFNSGTIYLEPLTGAHEAAVKFGNIENNGTITSRNDSRNAGDIYFKGTTTGTGSIEGFTGSLYYAYTGTEDITQSFYANSKYNEVTVYIGNRSATGEDYSHGLATLTENLSFRSLIIDGGNLAIGDAGHNITVDASSFVEITAGTITVNAGSVLTFSDASGTTFTSSLDNKGRVESAGDLVLVGTTSGDGLVRIADDKSITYAFTGPGEQTLFGFTLDSAKNLIIEGSTKVIATSMRLTSLTDNGADIRVNRGVTLELETVSGTAAAAVNGFTIFTEAGDESTDGGKLIFAAGELNAAIDNAGIVEVTATDDVTLGGTITTSGSFTVSSGAFAVVMAGTGTVTNSGSFSATANAGGSVTFNGTVTNAPGTTFEAEAEAGGNVTFAAAVENNAGGTFTATDAAFNSTITNRGSFTVAAVNTPVTVAGAVTNYGTFAAKGANDTNTVTFSGLVTNDSEVVDPETTLTGTLSAVNASFDGGVTVASGEFRIGENVSWSGAGLNNAGLVTVVSDLTVNGGIFTNTGTIVVAEGATLSFEQVSRVLDGTIRVDSGATLAVDVAGTIVNPTVVVPDTSGGVKLTGTLINRGTVTVSVSGDYKSVLDVAVFDNGDADSKSVLDIGDKSRVVVHASPYVDANLDPIINGNIFLGGDDAHLYFDGGIKLLSISVTIDGKSLSDFQSVVTNPLYKQVGIQVSKNGAADVAFTIDVDSADRISYTARNGATLILDVDEVQQPALPLTVAGSISADAKSTVRNASDGTEISGPVSIEGTLENTDGNELTVSGDNAAVGNAVNGTGAFTVSGSGSTVGKVSNDSGMFTASAGTVISEVTANSGNIVAADISRVAANFGTIIASGNVGDIGTNAAGASVTAGGDMGTVGKNSGDILVAGKIGDIGENAAGATLTVGGDIGDIGTNAGTITAGGDIGDIGSNTGNIDQTGDGASVGKISANSGDFTVWGDNVEVEEFNNASGGDFTVIGDNVKVDALNNASGGSVTVIGAGAEFKDTDSSGDVTVYGSNAQLTDFANASGGSVTVNGSGTTAGNFSNASGGSAEINGDLTAQTVSNAGDFDVSASGVLYADNVDNSGSFTIEGSGSRLKAVSNSGDFAVTGSGNSFGSFDNSGEFDYISSNDVGNISNSGTGVVKRDGTVWMMASDEGMSPELFSDGMNKNFSVLAHLTENILRDSELTPDALRGAYPAPPSAAGSMPGRQEGLSDLAASVSDGDMLGIDNEVDELIFGDTPALGDDEFEDVLSGDGSGDAFEAAIGEVVGK